MSKKDYLLRKAAEDEMRRRLKDDAPYRPWAMNSERMPLGCWLWILAAGAAAVYAIMKLMNVIH